MADSALLLQEIFEGSGAMLTFATKGETAVDMALKTDFQFILMDLRLPDIDGVQATKLILNKKPDISVIAQTANVSDDERQRCLNNGFAGYINKPIDKTELFKVINSIINKT